MPVLPEAEAGAPAPGECVLMPLTHLAVIEARGADATAFLHGQLSNDVQGLAIGGSLLAGYCNAKGRLYALPRLWRREDGWQICLPAETADAVLKRLRLFVLRSKVSLARREDAVLLGVAGDRAAECLGHSGLPVPAQVDAVAQQGELAVVRWPASPVRFVVCLPQTEAPSVWAALSARARPAPASVWRLLDIDAGLPSIYAPTLEAFVPQMVNLDLIDGVSFRKGCYPGQEIVARMHYLGKPSRRMYRLQGACSAPPPGSPVLDEAGREVGTVVDAQPTQQGTRLLAVLQRAVEGAPLTLPGGQALDELSLPYALDQAAPVV